jgi:enoyl-CoA hydratase/carnithine racemase
MRTLPYHQAGYANILTETRGAVGLITLNRPKALNALNGALIADINAATRAFDADAKIGAIVITGSERAFAAGADIKEMATKSYIEAYYKNMFAEWADLTKIVKPVSECSAHECAEHAVGGQGQYSDVRLLCALVKPVLRNP